MAGAAKYERVANVLRERIYGGGVAVGDSLPTMKQLAEEFGVSLVTAFRAVQMIADEGLVSTAARRSGTVVVRNEPAAPTPSRTIGCLLRQVRPRDDVDNFGLDMIQGVREAISERGYRFIYHGLDEQDYVGRMIEAVQSEGACGVLLDQKTPLPVLEVLSALGVPAVVFNRQANVPGLSTVCLDFEAMARDTVRLFRERGYERAGFFKMPMNEGRWTPALAAEYAPLVEARSAFLSAARAAGYEGDRLELIAEPMTSAESDAPETYGLPRRKPIGWRSLAIQAATDTNAVHILNAIRQTDLVLGRDAGVVGCYDLDGGRRSAVPPSTWRIDGRLIGAAAVRELLLRVERPDTPASRIHLPLEFVDRQTV